VLTGSPPGISCALVPGIGEWPFFPERKGASGTSILGSLDLDRYIVVPDPKLPIVRRLLAELEQGGTLAEAEGRLLAAGIHVDIGAFYNKLRGAGLVLGDDGKAVAPENDLQRTFVRIAGLSLKFANPLFNALGTSAWRTALMTLFASVSALAAITLLRLGFHTGVWDIYSGDDYFRSSCILVFCFCFHEMSHGVAAAALGCPPRSFEVGFYMGILPVFYLKIGRLYTLSPASRMVVWGAGPAGNVVLAVCAQAAAELVVPLRPVCADLAMVSAGIGVFNLFPFLPTDGYFLASTFLRRYNVRQNAWIGTKNLLRGRAPGSLFVTFYGLAALGTVVYLFGFRVWSAVSGYRAHPAVSLLSVAFVLLFSVALALRRFRGRR
jgi:Zn-dependent protease